MNTIPEPNYTPKVQPNPKNALYIEIPRTPGESRNLHFIRKIREPALYMQIHGTNTL